MVLDKPQDMAVILAIVSIVFIVAAIGIDSVNDAGASVNDSLYVDFVNDIESSTGFQGQAQNSIDALSQQNGSGQQFSEANIITQGFTGIVNLGQSWGNIWKSMQSIVGYLNIPPGIIVVLGGLLAISFFVVVYTWIRAN